jgi:hypothetical protein
VSKERAETSSLMVFMVALVVVAMNGRGLTSPRSCAAQSIETGGAPFYDSGAADRIVLDGAQNTAEMALALVHAVNHAKYAKEGKGAKINSDSRGEYVRKMLEEEGVATIASIEMKQDLQAAGKAITARCALEAEYRAAYEKAVDGLKKSKASASPAELDAAGKAAARAAVRDAFATGKVVTADTGERYPEYYGTVWDRAHSATTKQGGTGGHPARSKGS